MCIRWRRWLRKTLLFKSIRLVPLRKISLRRQMGELELEYQLIRHSSDLPRQLAGNAQKELKERMLIEKQLDFGSF